MKICFPVENDIGMESKVYEHFGSAPNFIVVDSDTLEISKIGNKDLDHSHGQCSPIKALNNNKIDVIIVGGIGGGAITKLNAMGVKVYRAEKETIKENLKSFKSDDLKLLTIQHACGGHQHGCSH